MTDLNFLKRIELFEKLTDPQLSALQPHCSVDTYRQENRIFAEGETAERLWVVKAGEVELRYDLPGDGSGSQTGTLSRMGPCRSFGWSALVPPFQYTLSAYCTSPTCETVSFEKRKLVDLFEADPQMGYEIMSRLATVVGERFHRLQEDIATRRGHEIMHSW